MAEKVKVSREVAEFIKSYEENVASYNGWEDHLIMEHSRAYFNSFEGAKNEALCMRNITPTQLAEILVNGYEVEQTPEEKFIEQYDKFLSGKTFLDIDEAKSVAHGMKVAIEILGIEIEGIDK